MLRDLHLNSITVGQLVSEAARHLGLPRVLGLTDFANATVAETARALEELKQASGGPRREDNRRQPPGVDIWTEALTADLVERLVRAPRGQRPVSRQQLFARVTGRPSPRRAMSLFPPFTRSSSLPVAAESCCACRRTRPRNTLVCCSGRRGR